MQKLSVQPQDCIVFEDAVSGVISAHAAGVSSIVGVYGDSSKELLAETGVVDVFIRDFRDWDEKMRK